MSSITTTGSITCYLNPLWSTMQPLMVPVATPFSLVVSDGRYLAYLLDSYVVG